MATEKHHQQSKRVKAKINSAVKDYGNDPFFVKKANESKQFLEKYGFPQAFQKRSDRFK